MGRDPPGQVVEQTSATRRCSSTTTGWSRSSPRTRRWTRWSRNSSAPTAGRSRTRLDQLLPVDQRHAGDDRERRPGLHGHANPVCPVPQPPVRPLDPGRLLRLRRLLLADRPQAGRRPARDHHLQLGRRRGEPPGRQPPDGAQVPRRRGARRRPARTAGSVLAKWLASPENPWFATSFANRVWAHFFGSGIVEPVDDFRVSNPATNPELLEAGQAVHRLEIRPQVARPRHLQLANVSAIDPAQRVERDRRAELRPRQPPADQGREPPRRDHARDRDQGQIQGPPSREPGPPRSPTAAPRPTS